MVEREPHTDTGLCERCWSDAFLRAINTDRSQYEHYLDLLEEYHANTQGAEGATTEEG